ncbi:MAG: hypothetical protein ACJAY8_000727 [Sphingobacteriales bacterium]|jgi:hypothetical protein
MGILGLFGKKRWNAESLASELVSATLFLLNEFEKDILYIINEHPEFVTSPKLKEINLAAFLTVTLSGNLALIKNVYTAQEFPLIKEHVILKLGRVLGMESEDVAALIKSTTSDLKRLNHPSKNILYGMSKGYFHFQGLNQFQPTYFKKLNNPHPIIQKSLDHIMDCFIWNWKKLEEDYKI